MSLFDINSVNIVGSFKPLVDPKDFLWHSILLLLAGFSVLVALIGYEVTHPTIKSRSLTKEMTLATSASMLLGVGALMAMLASGLYV